MTNKSFKHIYGPVYSWRLGMSLGIDPLSCEKKICSFDCVYCQLGKTDIIQTARKEYILSDALMSEINSLPKDSAIDYYTFSGRGEPTLASNLGDMIKALKGNVNRKVAVITNSSIIYREDVQKDLFLADFVVAKLDAFDMHSLNIVDKPAKTLDFDEIIHGIKRFKLSFKGKLAIQIMFIKENAEFASNIAKIVKEIMPDEVQINTPLRPCGVKPLSEKELDDICSKFEGLNVISVYNFEKKEYMPFNDEQTIKRHGFYKGADNS